jgi:hypothetical protein
MAETRSLRKLEFAPQQRADLLAGIAGVVLLLSMFLPWFGLSEAAEQALQEAEEVTEQFQGEPLDEPDVTENAWQAFTLVDLILLLAALGGIRAGVAAVARQAGRSPIGATAVTTGLGAVATLLILYRVINPIGEAGREYGIFIGLIAAIGIAAGGWLSLEQGERGRVGRATGRPRRAEAVGSRRDA